MSIPPRKVVTREQLEAVANEYAPLWEKPKPTPPPAPDPKSSPRGPAQRGRGGKPDNRVARCRAYLKKLPGAVEGQGGSGRTFEAARLIWNDFGLDEADGYPLLQEFNAACAPPWPEDGNQGLRRKWDEAVGKGPGPEGRGCKLTEREDDRAYATGGAKPEREDGRPPEAKPRPPGALPEIMVNERQYRDVEADAADALIKANKPPRVFVGNGGGLVDLIYPDPDQPPRARELDGLSMRPVFARVADWKEIIRAEKGDRWVDVFPPTALLNSFPARGSWPGIPLLRSIVSYPTFAPNWELIDTDGFHATSGIYCHLNGLDLPPVADQPTTEDVAAAKDLILTELMGDFLFADDASKANAIAMLLLPIVRHTIDGPTPLAVADAPAEGTGKSLLVEACMLITLGEVPEAMTADAKEEERDKTLLALLIEGQPIVYLDNANQRLDSASFANVLTARRKRGRILGETRTASALVNVCWIMTGNNFSSSREIARRLYWIRQDSGLETPAQRTGFRHPDLQEWVRANRPRLLWAILTLVRHWRATGAKPGKQVMGKFERWSKTIGGILEAAGISDFLGNAEAFRRHCADQVGEMKDFVIRWSKFGVFGMPKIAADLFDIASECLESVLTSPTPEGKKVQLGKYLKTNRDRVVAGFKIKVATDDDGKEDKDHSGRIRFYLERVADEPQKTGAGRSPSGKVMDVSDFEFTG